MTVTSYYSNLPEAEYDPIVKIMSQYASDPSPNKIDLTIGVYKAENGESYLFPSVAKAKKWLHANDPGHNYTNMAGIPEFTAGAREVIFGKENANQGKIASLQTISGTGACHMASLFLGECGLSNYYIGTPFWSNYQPMLEHAGAKVNHFRHYNPETREVDFESTVEALNAAPKDSVFLFQACCHNPTGADYSKEQWTQIADIMKDRDLFPFFDIAYQGFSSGDKDEDAWAIRHFYEKGLNLLACQSFSKNMGLYSERAGCLHVVVQEGVEDPSTLDRVQGMLVTFFRMECSFGPAFGARIAAALMNKPELKEEWDQDVAQITERLQNLRKSVLQKLTAMDTPGNWDHVIKQNGLFWYTGLNEEQVERITKQEHVYMTFAGRVNIASLNESNIDQFCRSLDKVVRETK